MLERKFYYKNECLLIKGARQIGKTFIVRQFGKNEYENFIEINFEENPEIKTAFAGGLDVNDLIQKLSAFLPRTQFIPNKNTYFF